VGTALIAERLASQLLSGRPARDPVAVTERLLAIQAQDLRGAQLAIRARTRGLSAEDLDAAFAERAVVISWLNRFTLHLVCAEDYPWLHALTTPQLVAANARRLGNEGVSPAATEKGIRVIRRALDRDGPLTRRELRERLDGAGVRTQGQALVQVLAAATLQGWIVRGPMSGRDHAFVLVSDWLGPTSSVDRDAALAELGRRFLIGHAPADDRDLAKWAGITLRDARAGLAAIAGELREREDGLLEPKRRRKSVPPLPPPRLLGQYEPFLLGWVDRGPVVGPHTDLVTNNGVFRPFALVRGRAVASWSFAGGEVALKPFAPVRPSDANVLRADAADVRRFLKVAPKG
jgi:hypothetical protein